MERRTRDRKVSSSNLLAGAAGEFSSRGLTLRADFLFSVSSTPVSPQSHVKDPGHSAKVQWPVPPEHAYTLDPAKPEWADYAAVQV